MKRFCFSAFQILLVFILASFAAEAAASNERIDIDLMQERYGPTIARIYREIEGMPRLALNSEPLPVLRYRKEKSPCNELFLRENPEMAEECNQSRETVTIENRFQKKLSVHISNGKINSMDFDIPIDSTDPLKVRKVLLLDGSLVVHDIVMQRYSHNLARIYFFPMGALGVELDEMHNLIISFGANDYIKFMAQDFRRTECQGFIWRSRSTFYRNRTRALPDIGYRGDQPYITTVNWTYPPLDGFLDLYRHSKQIGRIPASFLYQKQKDQRAKPLFAKTGLLKYLKRVNTDERIKKRYGPEIQEAVEKLLY